MLPAASSAARIKYFRIIFISIISRARVNSRGRTQSEPLYFLFIIPWAFVETNDGPVRAKQEVPAVEETGRDFGIQRFFLDRICFVIRECEIHIEKKLLHMKLRELRQRRD